MTHAAQRLIACCALLLVASGIGSAPLAHAQTYLCKQADGSEVISNVPTGGTCKPFNPQGGAMSQAPPSRGKIREQERAEAQRRAAEAVEAQRRATEAQNRRMQELLEAQRLETQRRAAEDMRRRAEEDAQRRAVETQRREAEEAQRRAVQEQRRAAEAQQLAQALREKEATDKTTLIMLVLTVGLGLGLILVFGIRERGTFLPSIYTCLIAKYADFSGRARRSEFWWFELFQLLVEFGIEVAAGAMALSETAGNGLSLLFFLATLLPNIAVTARRLHDVNRSGWWMLIPLTIIGIIPYLYWMCKEGDAQANEYGPPV